MISIKSSKVLAVGELLKVLLHTCCGVCEGSVAERLLSAGHDVTAYFYNPNIHPVEEYNRRLEVAYEVSKWLGIKLVNAEYDTENWFSSIKGLELEKEGGRRCDVCFRLRLENTYRYMTENGFDSFASTLTVSPHKPARVVNPIGSGIGGDKFLAEDFKKKDGFKRANEIAAELDIYRQHYCGCIYSLQERG